MLVFQYTNGRYEHLFNLQAADFDRPPSLCQWHRLTSATHNAAPEIYMTYMYMLWRSLPCSFQGQVIECFLLQLMAGNDWFNISDQIEFVFLSFFSVKEGLRETAKRQTEHSNTLRRWMLTLTWLRLTWRRYVSSHTRAAATNHASSSCNLHAWHNCLAFVILPPNTLPFPYSFFKLLFSPSMPPKPWLLVPLSLKDSKDWVAMCLMPWTVCKSWHCLSSTVICC